jgi:hypothetical protein
MNTKLMIMTLSLCSLTVWAQRTTTPPPQRPTVPATQIRGPVTPAPTTTQINYQQALTGQDRGGGDAIVCGRGHSKKAYLADYYLSNRINDSYEAIINHHYTNDQTELKLDVFGYISERDFNESWRVSSVYLTYIFTHRDLIELEDDNITLDFRDRLSGCRKQQLAIQHIIPDGVSQVLVAHELYARMSLLERVMLDIHERYINLMKEPGQDTSAIRERTMSHITSSGFGPYSLRKISGYDPRKLADLQFAVRVLANQSHFSGASHPEWSATHGIAEIYRELGRPPFNFQATMTASRDNRCTRLLTTESGGRVVYDASFGVWVSCVNDSIRY